MIPSALSGQLQQGLADFLRYSFQSHTPGMEHVVDDLLEEPGGLLKGPYVSLQLPFIGGSRSDIFPNVPLGFTPHLHQEEAFERLGGRRKRSTIVATGTGSGKTECFLLPILDYCLRDAANPGIKAILVYPMNALATDQAGRIARMVHGNDLLRAKVKAGLFIGQDAGRPTRDTQMGPTRIIADRETMRESPPDILLTNYKMLDYLLLRPGDQGLWQHNARGTLRFLVVDEIHTFDGAQGTDLACLIRRLKRRLQVDDGSLCCVGTSATLGGDEARRQLLAYAEAVFGEPFDESAVIGESRQSPEAYLAGAGREWVDEPTADDLPTLDPARWTDKDAWLRAQAGLWFGESLGEDDEWFVELGERLKRHAAFHALLAALGGRTVDMTGLVEEMARVRSEWRRHPDLGRLALTSLIGLVSAARKPKDTSGRPRPFLDVRVQLWQRELRRMVGSLAERPRLRYSMDLDRDTRRRHLPMVHCRECGAMGWATLLQKDTPDLLRTDLDTFYRAFFANDPRVTFLYPAAAVPEDDASWPARPFRLEVETLTRLRPEDRIRGPVIELVAAPGTKTTTDGPVLSRDCPFCAAHDSLAVVGLRAATLTSAYIDQMFASPFNDDKKLLTFSDSVQDAAHRAGFYAARTWRTNLRLAMHRVIAENDGLTLRDLGPMLGTYWRSELDPPTWVSTFLAPNMTWLHDWERFKTEGEVPAGSDLEALIERRLGFEAAAEFGLQSSIGRSLPHTAAATVAVDPERLDRAVEKLLEPMQNEVPGLDDLDPARLRRFLLGLLHHLRARGGILDGGLPDRYVESGGRDVYSFRHDIALPGFTSSSRLPELLTSRIGAGRFATWSGRPGGTWYDRWAVRSLGAERLLAASPADVYPVAVAGLVAAGLLRERAGAKGERIWGVDESALRATARVERVACRRCGDGLHVAAREIDDWRGAACLTARCPGDYEPATRPAADYFGRLYTGGDLCRVFAEEHTGLLTRRERERVEQEFKARPGPADDPDSRRPWYANLISCTPTLEMGIDIGDLSTGILCSVPPSQANYLQRVGRAGRRDGNSFVLTVAEGKPHDLYFFADPSEMFAGEVRPPGVFLDAPTVLERQLVAFCFDRWVAAAGDGAELPAQLKTVFAQLDVGDEGRFPHGLLAYMRDQREVLLREFGEMFAGAIGADTAAHLHDYLTGSSDGTAGAAWRILDAFYRERAQRDSLAGKARALQAEAARLEAAEAKSKDHADELDRLEQEKTALEALVREIDRRRTLEFLTGEGLLPNYAFPEAAVALRSVIWRKKSSATASGSRYDTRAFEYKRAPASALSELAPNADFYAGGRRVRITRVDLDVSKPESWRFCPDCNHAQSIETGDEADCCPACGNGGWKDAGQVFRLLRLQQVFARASDREARIHDDREDRQPRFFQRQILVDIDAADRAGAWHIDDELLPFGFEYLRRATFREVNFGEPSGEGAASLIAGQEAVRPGFRVCARCGTVQDPGADPKHDPSCPSRKPGARQQTEDCLYLYREFQSEAIRLLLPLADLGRARQLHSFVAALHLGLRARFGGSVDHLATTVYSEPSEGTSLRKQYLVIYDTVPGGTGYLKQLVTPAAQGARMPLMQVLEAALARIRGCSCWSDPERDGCYRCLYAYRNAHDMDDTSAGAAAELLGSILAAEARLQPIESLGQVSIAGLMDSVLELRFVEALRLITDASGRQARLRPAVVNKKPGYRWSLGDAEWLVEPQVEPPKSQTCGVPVSIDFALRPADPSDPRRLAVFLDGWRFHQDRIGTDLLQRTALLASHNWDVWALTWSDLNEKFGLEPADERLELAVPDPARFARALQDGGLANLTHLASQSTFAWLEQELTGDGLPWDRIAACVLAARMDRAMALDHDRWRDFVARVAPPAVREPLQAMVPMLISSDQGETNELVELMAVHDGRGSALLCRLDDRRELEESHALRRAWNAYLRLFQWLRRAPAAWLVARSSTAHDEDYGRIAAILAAGEAAEWACLPEIEPSFQALAESLMEAGVEEPEIGVDVPDERGHVWAQAEMAWQSRRVALTCRDYTAGARGAAAAGWRMFDLQDVLADISPLLAALLPDRRPQPGPADPEEGS